MKVSARESRPFSAFRTIDFTETIQTYRKMKVSAREARFLHFGPSILLKTFKTLGNEGFGARSALSCVFGYSISLKTFKPIGK